MALLQTRGRALTDIALHCFAEKRRWYEWLPVLGDCWLRRRLRGKWRPGHVRQDFEADPSHRRRGTATSDSARAADALACSRTTKGKGE